MGATRDPELDERRPDAAAGSLSADARGLPSETVDSLADRWLASRTDVREVTLQGYRDVLVPVRNRLGNRLVSTLTTSDMRAMVTWMSSRGGRRGQPLSPRSVAAALGAFSQALDLAQREGTVTVNVARAVERPKQVKRRLVTWTPEDVRRFQDHAVLDRLGAAWLLSLAGLRRAEVLGLRWQDADLAEGRLRIEQSRVAVTPTSDAIAGLTRGQERRSIQIGMVPGVLPALRQLRDLQAAERREVGAAYRETGLVVVDEAGFPLRPAWYSDRFATLCRAADIPVVPLRNLRCTAVDFLLGSGLRRECLREWLGQEPDLVLARCAPDALRTLHTE